jgi:alginate O-acetyltransferase complex protein AlgI
LIFTELIFFAFFAALFVCYWLLQTNRNRKLLLLLASYAFYAAWDWRFLGLICLSTIVDYAVGLMLAQAADARRRKALLFLSLTVNLGMLGIFKYFNFFTDSLAIFLQTFGVAADWNTLNIILPVGISFYTFQTLSYTIDIYRGSLKPTRNLLDFSLFVAFFPQLVAGPIVRARDFLYQLDEKKTFRSVDFRWAATLFTVGFIKKAVIADNLAGVVDSFYFYPAAYDLAGSWVAVAAFAAQIYCDFSGYTDMAIAIAGFLGYRLCDNFASPYIATSITEFWQRWHISLSTWLRDYLYIPLGGNRLGTLITYRNLMLTMLLGGLWHGASWNFVLWGGLHGIGLAVHRIWSGRTNAKPLPAMLAMLLTLLFVILLWIPFRAPDFTVTLEVIRQLFALTPATTGQAPAFRGGFNWQTGGLATALVAMLLLHYFREKGVFFQAWRQLPRWLYSLCLGGVFALAIAFRAVDSQPFIYFQF